MEKSICFAAGFLSVVPIRAIPSDAAEMVSQLLFGEQCEVLEISANWARVKTCYDHYHGWIDEKQLIYLPQELQESNLVTIDPVSTILKGEYKRKIYLPAGSSLPAFQGGRCYLGKDFYQVLSNNITIPNVEDFSENISDYSIMFLNAPYLWGGRTINGIDCSGFSQIVFKLLGIKLQRDASQQATQGKVVDFLTEAQAGDLAFFDNEEGKITHVGIMLNNAQIIHASGRVKIDRIDNQGIFSEDLQRYTHKLRIIKRYI